MTGVLRIQIPESYDLLMGLYWADDVYIWKVEIGQKAISKMLTT